MSSNTNETQSPPESPTPPRRGRSFTFIELLVIIAIIVACCGLALPGGTFFIEVPITLALGWIKYLSRVVPNAKPDPWVIGTALVCLLGVIIGAHLLCRWLSGVGSQWPMKRTLQFVGLVVLLFVAGIAMVGMTHQTAWLTRSPEPLVSGPDARPRAYSANNLKQIGLAAHNYHDNTKPPALPRSTFDATGRPLHSWQTALLPYIEQDALYRQIDLTKPWTDPANANAMRTMVKVYLHPAFSDFKGNDFVGISHYAGNVQIVLSDKPLTLPNSFPQGTSNVILAGEVSSNFQAWGDPFNARDPRLGAKTFSGPNGRPAQFVMLDGSVRTFDAAELAGLAGKVPE
ncbi:MAG: DUF1559 domain-containing protein [Planctomycetia bacterium]|nr:DUF1559 domain-containing protein [Planctomycetia bacterium]